MFGDMLKNITKIAPPSAEPPQQRTPVIKDLDEMGIEVEEIVESPQADVDHRHPMIISGDHFAHNNPNKLAMLRIRNKVSELRQMQWDLTDLIEEQRNLAEINYAFLAQF